MQYHTVSICIILQPCDNFSLEAAISGPDVSVDNLARRQRRPSASTSGNQTAVAARDPARVPETPPQFYSVASGQYTGTIKDWYDRFPHLCTSFNPLLGPWRPI